MGRNYAKEKSNTARKARPLGEFIVGQLHQKVSGPPCVPQSTADASRLRPESHKGAGRNSGREAPVLRACLKWLHKRGIFAWRNNTRTVWLDGRPIYFGYPGSGDIIGILPDGRFLSIETKRPKGGKQQPNQIRFQQNVETNNGVYLLVRSEEELAQCLESYLETV